MNNIFDQKPKSYGQMEVLEIGNNNNNQENQQNEQNDQEISEKEMLRKCISEMMSKKSENCRSKKRKDLLNLHRNRIIENTLDMLNFDNQYYTTEEFEYQICMNIDKLIQEQEEYDQQKYEMDQELQRAEEEYYQRQILQFQQEQEYEEQNNQQNFQ